MGTLNLKFNFFFTKSKLYCIIYHSWRFHDSKKYFWYFNLRTNFFTRFLERLRERRWRRRLISPSRKTYIILKTMNRATIKKKNYADSTSNKKVTKQIVQSSKFWNLLNKTNKTKQKPNKNQTKAKFFITSLIHKQF